jgi:hypothetical protein
MKIRLQLPNDCHLEARVGDRVKFGDSLYSTVTTEKSSINVAKILRIEGDQLFHRLTKVIGDTVTKGEVIATKKGVLRAKKVHADRTGTLVEIDHTSGDVIIATSETQSISTENIQTAFFSGKIEEFDNNSKIMTVTVEKSYEIDLKSVSANGGGEIFFFSDEGQYFTASEDQIANKIIILSDLKPHIVAKCEALEALGFVYLTGRLDLPVNGAQVTKIADFEGLAKHKKKYILYSMLDKKALLYDA